MSRPAKRFQELPGGVKRRESERYGGPLVEKGVSKRHYIKQEDVSFKFNLKKKDAKNERRSTGVHRADLPEIRVGKPLSLSRYQKDAEEYKKERLKEDASEVEGTSPQQLLRKVEKY